MTGEASAHCSACHACASYPERPSSAKKSVSQNFPFPLRLPTRVLVSGKIHFLSQQNKWTHTLQQCRCASVSCLLSHDTDLQSLWTKDWIVKLWIWVAVKLLWGYTLWDLQLTETCIAMALLCHPNVQIYLQFWSN